MRTVPCTHTGDNRTGEGDGDDESLKIKLDAVPSGS
ncbi:TerD family protein [Escherichia coli]|nr:TerD family protein [Escherichia coli]